MTRICFTGIFFVVLSSHLIAQNISPTDFRIPESRYRNLFGSLRGDYGNSRHGSIADEDKSNNGGISFSLNSVLGHNSESEAYNINSSINGEYDYRSQEYSPDYFSDGRTSDKNTHERGEIRVNGQYSSYLIPDRVYLYGSGELWGAYNYNHATERFAAYTENGSFHKDRWIDASLGTGLGYGKTREASSVFAVVRIIQKLNEDGYLTRELTREELLEVVDIYAKRIEYSVHYERPTKYFLDDLLKKLESFGVLKDQRTTAYETARVEEVFQESIFPRIVGWTVQAGASYDLENDESSSSDSWSVTKYGQYYFTVGGEYGYPFSLSLHWYNQAKLSLPISGKQKIAYQYVKSALYYQIGEKVSNELSVVFNRYGQYYVFDNSNSSTNSFGIGNTFRYFIENNINFSITASYYDTVHRSQDMNNMSRETSGWLSVSFGLNYRFF